MQNVARRPLPVPIAVAILAFLAVMSAVGPAAAQALPGGSSEESTRKPGVFSDIMDAIDSGSRLLIEQIQPGDERDLVENPRFNAQTSPRAAIMTFMEAMALVDRGYDDLGYGRALASLPPGASRADADRLHGILLRLGPIDPAGMPGRNEIEQSGDTRFELFPRGMDHEWVWSAGTSPPRGVVAVIADGIGTWRFSGQTLSNAEDLAEALADLPPQYGESDAGGYFVQVFSPIVNRTSAFQLVAFLLLTAFGVLCGYLFAKLMGRGADAADERDHPFIASTMRGVGRAGGLVFFTVLFTIAIGFVELGPVLRELRYEIPRFLLVVAVALFVLSLVDMSAAFIRRRIEAKGSGHYDRMVITIVQRVVRVVVVVIVLIFVLQNVLGMNVGALLLGFGVIGLALSLAAQDSVKNLFGALSVFLNRPFVIGDWIRFRGEMGEHLGVVEDIELQATKLRVMSGDLVTIPNMQFINREIQNLSARGYIRREMDIAIPYTSESGQIDLAIDTLKDVLNSDEVLEDAHAKDRKEPHVSFSNFSDSWLNIKCYHFYFMGEEDADLQRDEERGWFTFLDHCTLVNRKVFEAFEKAGLTFAFPTRTISLETDAHAPFRIEQTSGSVS